MKLTAGLWCQTFWRQIFSKFASTSTSPTAPVCISSVAHRRADSWKVINISHGQVLADVSLIPASSVCTHAVFLLPLCLHPDGFDLGAATDADREQAERVPGEPGADRPAPPEKRGDLEVAESERSHTIPLAI